MNCQFKLKTIRFKSDFIKILCQNENGPCPLLAIANALILRQKLSLANETISGSTLMQEIANTLFSINEEECGKIDKNMSLTSQVKDELKVRLNEQLNYIVDILPTLMRGLDVNVKFNDADSFEYTQELSVFDGFNLQCFHGWVVEPNTCFPLTSGSESCSAAAAAAAGSRSLNDIYNSYAEANVTGVIGSSGSCTSSLNPPHIQEHAILSRLSYNECVDRVVGFEEAQKSLCTAVAEAEAEAEAHAEKLDTAEMQSRDRGSVLGRGSAGDELCIALGPPETFDTTTLSTLPPPPATVQPERVAKERITTLATQLANLRAEYRVIQSFLSLSASQLTHYGLVRLHALTREDVAAILFRNNHFNVVYKHEGSLFVLVTDEGFTNPGGNDAEVIVWEMLQDIGGWVIKFVCVYFQVCYCQ